MTSEICTQRHHEGLFRKMREHLPAIFGFEAVGVLMYNCETNQFFTDLDSAVGKEKQDESSEEVSEDDLKNPKDEDKKKNGKKNDKQNV